VCQYLLELPNPRLPIGRTAHQKCETCRPSTELPLPLSAQAAPPRAPFLECKVFRYGPYPCRWNQLWAVASPGAEMRAIRVFAEPVPPLLDLVRWVGDGPAVRAVRAPAIGREICARPGGFTGQSWRAIASISALSSISA
jgi:hypothetical protein